MEQGSYEHGSEGESLRTLGWRELDPNHVQLGGFCVNDFELSDPASRVLVSVVVPCVQSAGYALAQLVEAVCFNPAGCGFVSRWNLWDFSFT